MKKTCPGIKLVSNQFISKTLKIILKYFKPENLSKLKTLLSIKAIKKDNPIIPLSTSTWRYVL